MVEKVSTSGFPRFLSAAGLAMAMAACAGQNVTYDVPPSRSEEKYQRNKGSLFGGEGEAGFALFDFGDKGGEETGSGGAGIGVNGYLWRASLDTISFMPLASADPFGGVIITDWYAPPEARAERFKVTLYILGRELRADGIRAAVFRQERGGDGGWSDAAVEPATTVDLENSILARARQLRVAGLR